MYKSNLTPKMQTCIFYIIQSNNITEACKLAKITRQQYYSWLKLPFFKSELDRQEKEILHFAGRQLVSNVKTAVDVLIKIIKDDISENKDKLKGIEILLNTVLKFKEHRDLEQIHNDLDLLKEKL